MERSGAWDSARCRLIVRLGELMQVVGFDSYVSSARYFAQALALHQKAGDEAGAAAMHARLALLLGAGSAINDNPAALRHLQAAEPLLRNGPPDDARLSFFSALGLLAVWQVRTSDGLADSKTAMGIARELNADDRWVTNAIMQSHHLHALGHVREGLELAGEAWETAHRLNNTYRAFVAANWPALRLLSMGAPLEARQWCLREVDEQREVRAPTRRRMLLDSIVDSHAQAGELDEARRIVAETGANPGAELAFYEGHWDRLEAGWERQRQAAPLALNRSIEATADWWLARIRRVRGDTEGTIAGFSAAFQIGIDGPSSAIRLKAGVDLAIALAEAGRGEEARDPLANCLEILASGEDWRGLAGRVALAEAVTSGLGGSLEESEGHFTRAISIFRRHTLPWDEAEGMLLRGVVLARAGRTFRREAAESFAAASAALSRHGAASPWCDYVDAVRAGALGGRPHVPRRGHPDGLTQRETEILCLLAQGNTSRQIGESLVLSVRTVERHIANIYLKTGVHGRAQATAYALSHGLGGQRHAER